MWRLLIASWLLAVQPGLSQQATPPPAQLQGAQQELRKNVESVMAAVFRGTPSL